MHQAHPCLSPELALHPPEHHLLREPVQGHPRDVPDPDHGLPLDDVADLLPTGRCVQLLVRHTRVSHR
eukprot:7447163-Alexandrium_andersonii.AAC.1